MSVKLQQLSISISSSCQTGKWKLKPKSRHTVSGWC